MNEDIELRTQELIKHIFFDVLDIIGRVFVAVAYSEQVRIGTRGFLPEEKEKGLIVVFNKKMNFQWQETGIYASLVFSGAFQKCFIPLSNIMAIYSPELRLQFVIEPFAFRHEETKDEKKPMEDILEDKGTDNIVQVDFTKKRR
jgi:hypothetical protein